MTTLPALHSLGVQGDSTRFPKGSILREDRPPVPAEALREIIANTLIHRDRSDASSYVAIAVFNDRIGIHSIGEFPTGTRAELLSRERRSVPRSPPVAGAFHRTGAIEACRAHGVAGPTFSEGSGAVTVTVTAAGRAALASATQRGEIEP